MAIAFTLAVSVWGTHPASSPWSWPQSFVVVPDAALQEVVSSSTDLSDIFLKRSGEGWAMWDRQQHSNISTAFGLDLECRWTAFRATTGQEAPICVHSERDIVSNRIIRKGRWNDCDSLTTMWNDNTTTRTDRSIYVEIGANIGACVMQMLLKTNATIVAFEPNPSNQFCLMSTLLRLEPSYRNRVSLFPLALGNSRASSKIYTAVGNYGNSVVEREIKDMPSQTFKKSIPIQVERLDSILNSNADVALMKMDAQGYECYIMEGMGNALPHHIQLIKTEVAKAWLDGFDNCSTEIFTDQLRAVGFDLFQRGNLLRGPVRPRSPFIDIVAKQKREKSSV